MKIFGKALSAFILCGLSHQGLGLKIDELGLSTPLNDASEETTFSRRLDVCYDNFVENPIGDSANGPLESWVGERCTLTSIDDAYLPGSKAFKVTDRFDLNAGPIQHMTADQMGCFVEGTSYTFTMRMKLEDADGNGFVCNGSQWNQPTTCPLLSFRIEQPDGSAAWVNSWNQANLAATGGWQADDWNEYTTTFVADAAMISASVIYFTVRGPAVGISIYFSDPVLSVSLPPTVSPTVAPTLAHSSVPTVVASGSPTVAHSYTPTILTQPCDLGISYENFENGNPDTSPWVPHNGGTLSLYDTSSEGDGSQLHALKLSSRSGPHEGPKHPVNPDCFVTDTTLEINAFIKLVNATDQSPYSCDPAAGPSSTCPILTLETVFAGGAKNYYYAGNEAQAAWDPSGFNEYHGYFHLDDVMVLAQSAGFIFERPPPGIDIIIDNITVSEFQPIPIANFHLAGDDFVYADCNDLVTNGDAELGDTSGWTPRLGGHLTVRPEGADGTAFSFQHSGRTSFIMGPKHALKTQCFVEGMRYAFDAKIKLLDENGAPFECDKTHTWIDEKSCPLLTFQLTDPNGDKSWKYYGNEAPNDWDSAIWNPFNTFFTIDEDIATAASAYFYVERPRAGISLIIDQVAISRDCTTLIANGDAENGSLSGWTVRNNGGGAIVIHPEGAGGSMNSYGHFGRTSSGGGPSHMIDLGCLVLGRQYEFTAKFKLLDEDNNMAPYHCRNDVAWGDPLLCPIFAITMIDSNGVAVNAANYLNIDPSTIIADNFNNYRAIFTVDEAMATATEARILIKGPRPGVATLMDDIAITLYEPPQYDCDSMIPRGDFEDGDYSRFDIRQSGSLQIYPEGFGTGSKSLLVVERTMVGSGLRVDLNTTCLVEGRRYKFEAQMKLLTADGDPFDCIKSKGYADPLACPLLGFEFNSGGTTQTAYYSNEDPSVFNSTVWNPYSVIFTVSHSLASADNAFFMVTGPAPNIGIVLDRVSLDEYIPAPANCNQMVQNGNAETGSMSGWKVNAGGHISIISGGDNGSAHAFEQTDRTDKHFGPKQDIPTTCLNTAGDQYSFSAQLKLVDANGDAFACDKNAAWGTALSCPLLSIEIQHPTLGMKRFHFGNSFSTPWDANEWNSYHSTVTLNQDMVEADSAFFFLQGPAAGISIIFDNVALTALPPSP